MSEASMKHRGDEHAAGRHRGEASAEENEAAAAPRGRHRRTEDN